MIAVVGSRRPTAYGREVTYKLAYDLASAGVTVVSGLAYGLDGVAHQAALDAGGLTIAVLAHGLDKIYPSANRGLGEQILAHGGALISEYPVATPALKQHFVARNRLVSGLSSAVIVTEADASSGTLLTANFALQQNRVVMAVPGNITSPKSAGPNNLLRSGAVPVTSAEDVLAALELESPALAAAPVKADSKEEAQILDLLRSGITTNQALLDHSGLAAAKFAHIISLMEITGKVRNLGAGQWVAR